MGNEIMTSQLREVKLDPNSMYAKRWNEASTKNYLSEKMKFEYREKSKVDPDFHPSKITEAKLIREHFKQFCTMDRSSDQLVLLLNNTALEREDFEKIMQELGRSLEHSLYTSLACSFGSYWIYKNYFQKSTLFYNYFRKPNQHRITRIAKKYSAGFFLFYAWYQACNYLYKLRTTARIIDTGLYDKYLINYQDKNMYD